MKFEDCLYKDVCENECKDTCIRYLEMKYMLKHSNIPKIKQRVNQLIPDDCDVDAFLTLAGIRDDIVDFTECGNSLYIYSTTCGNGKTTWSIKLLLQYFNEKWAGNCFTKRGIFINVPTFLYKCKDVISHPDSEFESMKQDLFNVDIVVWDDIAASNISNYDFTTLLAILDYRVLNEMSNIYTSNIVPSDLERYLGTKLSSRINEGIKVCLKGGDKR